MRSHTPNIAPRVPINPSHFSENIDQRIAPIIATDPIGQAFDIAVPRKSSHPPIPVFAIFQTISAALPIPHPNFPATLSSDDGTPGVELLIEDTATTDCVILDCNVVSHVSSVIIPTTLA